jgi:hypothetical protein
MFWDDQANRAGRTVDVLLSGVPDVILRQEFLDGIRKGAVTVAFRRWRRPSVKTGGTLLTAIGLLHIRNVSPVTIKDISDADARHAGYENLQALVDELNERADGNLYRIDLGALEADPRIALRKKRASESDVQDLIVRLDRLDARANGAPWTRRVLDLIDAHPSRRAGDLCTMAHQDKMTFKLNVRKLKTLGLTESLEVGYRLSPRGAALLDELRRRG